MKNITQHIKLTAISNGRVLDRHSPEFTLRRESGATFKSETYYTKSDLSQPYPDGGRGKSRASFGGPR